jgi:hypothetical protein
MQLVSDKWADNPEIITKYSDALAVTLTIFFEEVEKRTLPQFKVLYKAHEQYFKKRFAEKFLVDRVWRSPIERVSNL